MPDTYTDQLNNLLEGIYKRILLVEERMLKNSKLDLSIAEVHTLEAVANLKLCTPTDIAVELGVTKPTVTVSLNKLEQKGYVEKKPSTIDGRRIQVVLTKKGSKVASAHRYFHKQMIRSLLKEVGVDERAALMGALTSLHAFLERTLENNP